MAQRAAKRVLIITYYWPPSGGVGVQRWLKFVKYLRSYGWEPVVYTPENPESHYDDTSLLAEIPDNLEIVKTKIWEPYNIYKIITGSKDQKIAIGFVSPKKKKGFVNNLMIWLRGNLIIPDPRRFWVKPSVKFLSKYLRTNPVDAIITTGPPHSMHLIGYKLRKKLNVRWLADFRDPWTNIDFYRELKLGYIADSIHHRLEKNVVRNADAVIVVSEQMCSEFKILQPKRIEVITNGFDNDDLSDMDVTLDNKFSIAHVGTLSLSRNPEVLWHALAELLNEIPTLRDDLEIKLVGQVDHSVVDSADSYGLLPYLTLINQLSHSEAVTLQRKVQVLLLVVNNAPNAAGILTGKFFEYLASGRVIMGIGPTTGDLAKILKQTGAGGMIDYDDLEMAKSVIKQYYSSYKEGSLKAHAENISQYSRKELTGKLVEVLENR